MKKTVCFTIDIEPDFGGLLQRDKYYGVQLLPRLLDIVDRYNIKITAFVTGKTLEENSGILNILSRLNAEVEQHSYSHKVGHGQKIEDIERGIRIHEKILGKKPMGYRAPQGIITHQEVKILEKHGIVFDSSIFPAFFPGRFNRTNFPVKPFKIANSNILEIPFAVIPTIRIPIGLSYSQLLGFSMFKLLFSLFKLPELLVYDFHCYELGKVDSYSDLPFIPKMGYLRAQRIYKDPLIVFENFVKYILGRGYESKFMMETYNDVLPTASVWDWGQD